MGDFGLHEGKAQCVGRHLDAQVGAVVQCTRHFPHGRRPRIRGPPDPPVCRKRELKGFAGHLAPEYLGRVHDRVRDGFVAVAAAGVTMNLEPAADLLPGGIRVLIKECLGGNHHPGHAETALRGAIGHQRELYRMQVAWISDAFHRGHAGFVRHAFHAGNTGPHELAVEDDRTATTLALPTADLRPGHVQLVAQNAGQAIVGRDDQVRAKAVHEQGLVDHVLNLPFPYENPSP